MDKAEDVHRFDCMEVSASSDVTCAHSSKQLGECRGHV